MKIYQIRTIAVLAFGLVALPLVEVSAQNLPVPAGTEMVIQLENGINSDTSRVGDKFTAKVVEPAGYAKATVQGHISRLKKSGKLKGRTEIGFEFDKIRLQDGRSGTLKAELLGIRQSESVKVVDEEGNVKSGSRGDQAIKRGAIAGAIGGALGGIIGGGKGALIGILAGVGAGAGSLVLEGAKELRLESGTEMEIRTLGKSGGSSSARRPSDTP